MSTLQEFLNSNVVDGLTEEVAISDRFKDKDGKLLKFKIKAMTGSEFEDIRKKSMKVAAKGKRSVEMDLRKMNNTIVIENTLDPSFKDAESIKKLGCANPEEYLEKVLLAGEIAELANQIQRLSGFHTDLSELVEEVKN